jgi:hypothetical protein
MLTHMYTMSIISTSTISPGLPTKRTRTNTPIRRSGIDIRTIRIFIINTHIDRELEVRSPADVTAQAERRPDPTSAAAQSSGTCIGHRQVLPVA